MMLEHPIVAEGTDGTLYFDGAFLTIKRRSLIARLIRGSSEKRIPTRSINAVQFKHPGLLTRGFISFSLAGAIEATGDYGSRTESALYDENSVLFDRKHVEGMEALQQAVEDAISQQEV